MVICWCDVQEELKVVEFSYNGFYFTVRRNPKVCEECTKEEMVELFNKFGTEIVEKTGNRTYVNWDVYIRDHYPPTLDTHIVNNILSALRFLSDKSNGNWVVVKRGEFIVNPRGLFLNAYTHYFTEKKEAEKYASILLDGEKEYHIWRINEEVNI